MERCLLSMLPSSVFLQLVVVDYLDFRDIAFLDRAVLSKQLRSHFRVMEFWEEHYSEKSHFHQCRLFSDINFTSRGEIFFSNNALADWIIGKRIKTRSMRIYNGIVAGDRIVNILKYSVFREVLACANVPSELKLVLDTEKPLYLTEIVRNCNDLQMLTLNGKIPERSCRTIFESFEKLTHLKMTNNASFTGTAFTNILSAGLQSLSLSGCSKLTAEGLGVISRQCPGLTHVDVSCCASLLGDIDDLFNSCGHLQFLDISNNPRLRDCFQNIATSPRSFQSLRELRVYCTGISCSELVNIAVHCSQLESLWPSHNTAAMQDIVMFAIGSHCHKLKLLNGFNTPRVTALGVCAVLAGCPLLTELSLSSCNLSQLRLLEGTALTSQLKSLGDKAAVQVQVPNIVPTMAYLTTLDLTGNNALEDCDVCAVLRLCPALTTLSISYCQRLTDDTMRVIASECHQLTSLDFSSCARISDLGLIAVLQSCGPALVNLVCANCSNIGDMGAMCIASSLSSPTYWRLREVHFGGTAVTFVALDHVLHRCLRLKHMVIPARVDLREEARKRGVSLA